MFNCNHQFHLHLTVGRLKVHREVPILEIQEKEHPELEPGGRFNPKSCRARHKVAVIIPYRDREEHLAILAYHLHPMLQRQQIDYGIFVIEQAGKQRQISNDSLPVSICTINVWNECPENIVTLPSVNNSRPKMNKYMLVT